MVSRCSSNALLVELGKVKITQDPGRTNNITFELVVCTDATRHFTSTVVDTQLQVTTS